MILIYLSIGELVIEKRGITDTRSTEYKKYVLGHYCSSLSGYTHVDKDGNTSIGRLLVLNLDTSAQRAEFYLGEQLTPDKYDDVMLFIKPAPNDPNIFGTTNAFSSIVGFSLWNILEGKFKRGVDWSKPDNTEVFLSFLHKLRDCFFVKTKTGYLLNSKTIIDDQNTAFPNPLEDEKYNLVMKDSDYSTLLKADLNEFHKNSLRGLYDKNQGFTISVDGKYLHKGEFAAEYYDVLYHKIVESNYAKAIKGVCHLCQSDGVVTEDVALKQKFYGTSNPLYFDGASKNRTYSSFGICKACDIKLKVGMSYAMKSLNHRMVDLSTIIIPNTDKSTGLIDPHELETVTKVLSRHQNNGDSIYSYIETLGKLSQKCNSYNLLFYHKEPMKQEFKVISLISDLRFYDLERKTQDMNNISEFYSLYLLGDYVGLSLYSFRMLTLPSKRSHKLKSDGDYSSVAKNIALLVEKYLKNRSFEYNSLVRSFIDVWSHIEYDNQQTYLDHELSAFFMILYMKHLINFDQLKGVKAMGNEQQSSTRLDEKQHEKYLEYFENHAFLFNTSKTGIFYQGLFMLGVMIGRIEAAEYKKTGKKTFSSRLNFKGISPRKVQALYNTIEEYIKIRDVWTDSQALAFCSDALSEIGNSSIMPQEVVFYLLSGRAYENYLAIIYNKSQKPETQTKEDEND